MGRNDLRAAIKGTHPLFGVAKCPSSIAKYLTTVLLPSPSLYLTFFCFYNFCRRLFPLSYIYAMCPFSTYLCHLLNPSVPRDYATSVYSIFRLDLWSLLPSLFWQNYTILLYYMIFHISYTTLNLIFIFNIMHITYLLFVVDEAEKKHEVSCKNRTSNF